MIATTITRMATKESLQWKNREEDSSTPAISKIISSKSVRLRAKVMENMS
jgi:hypothetical protein